MSVFTVDEIKEAVMGDDIVGGSAAVWLHATDRNMEVTFDTTESDIDVYTSSLTRPLRKTSKGRNVDYNDVRVLLKILNPGWRKKRGENIKTDEVRGVKVLTVDGLLKIYREMERDRMEEAGADDLYGGGEKIKANAEKINLLEKMKASDDENDARKENRTDNNPIRRQLRF